VIFIVSGPGGVGKGTIVREVVDADPSLWLSRSWTTRERRPGEPADAYKFVSEDRFRDHVDSGGFLEWVEFLGARYGSPVPHPPPDKDLLLEIELKGAQSVRAVHPDAIVILVVPPSLEIQRQRLRVRGDNEQRIQERIDTGQKEMAIGESIADEIVINDDLTAAVEKLAGIVAKYRRLRPPGSHPD